MTLSFQTTLLLKLVRNEFWGFQGPSLCHVSFSRISALHCTPSHPPTPPKIWWHLCLQKIKKVDRKITSSNVMHNHHGKYGTVCVCRNGCGVRAETQCMCTCVCGSSLTNHTFLKPHIYYECNQSMLRVFLVDHESSESHPCTVLACTLFSDDRFFDFRASASSVPTFRLVFQNPVHVVTNYGVVSPAGDLDALAERCTVWWSMAIRYWLWPFGLWHVH